MKTYLLSLLAAALALAVIGILFPSGDGGGISKHLKFAAALVWLCILISPILSSVRNLQAWWNGLFTLSFSKEDAKGEYDDRFDELLENASTDYFCDMLIKTLETEFGITPGNIDCRVVWDTVDGNLSPKKITLLLSGKAIWKSPYELEEFVTNLVGCECVTAIQ